MAVRPGEAVFLDLTAVRNQHAASTLALKLGSLARRFGYLSRIAFAEDAPTALALTRFQAEKKQELPIEALLAYAQPFRDDPELEKEVWQLISMIRLLGIRDLEGFLSRGLGKEGTDLREQLDRTLRSVRLRHADRGSSEALRPSLVRPVGYLR